MEIWVPGVLAMVGAIGGVVLSSFLGGRNRTREARIERIEDAFKCVSLVIAARDFSPRVGVKGTPPGVRDADIVQLERDIYLGNVRRYFSALHDARRAVALVSADSVDVGNSWKSDALMQEEIGDLFELLRTELEKNGWRG